MGRHCELWLTSTGYPNVFRLTLLSLSANRQESLTTTTNCYAVAAPSNRSTTNNTNTMLINCPTLVTLQAFVNNLGQTTETSAMMSDDLDGDRGDEHENSWKERKEGRGLRRAGGGDEGRGRRRGDDEEGDETDGSELDLHDLRLDSRGASEDVWARIQ
jgi:hypothetical protein